MDNIYDKINELTEALQQSEQYLNLKAAKNKINADEEKKHILNEFMQKQFEVQKAQMLGVEVDDETMDELEIVQKMVMMQPDVVEFLSAQYNFAQLWADIQRIVGDVVGDIYDIPDGGMLN